jgi:methylmalonyl-CoA/ethylmalonyl-CoA epimerase
LLAPTSPESFRTRFLLQRGEGVHHLTFRGDSIEDSAAAAEAAGYRTIGLDTSREDWKEVFLHPASAHGTLIEFEEWPDGSGDSGPPRDANQAL